MTKTVAAPLAWVDRELVALRASAGVRLVNESFGALSRFGLETVAHDAGCADVDYRAYYRVVDQLDRDVSDAHAEPDVLFVRSAGNDGALLNSIEDGEQCRPGDPTQLLVGSYAVTQARSFFTNFGDCVDVYAPGENIVAPVPGDWLAPVSGTSFSAPLTLRHLLLAAPAPFSPATARAALAAEREPNRNLAPALFPSELVYDLSAVLAKHLGAEQTGGALVAGSGRSGAAAIGPRALRRVLAPWRSIRRHRR